MSAAMSARVFVGNLNPKTTKTQIASFLSRAGRVMSVMLPTDRDTGRPRGFAFVDFAEREAAEMALEICDGLDLDGHAVRLSWARERDGGGDRLRGSDDRRDWPARDDEEDAGGYGGRVPTGSRRFGERFEDDDEEDARRRRRHGKHGSDRKRGRGTRRVIE